jgi:hypothetical protein
MATYKHFKTNKAKDMTSDSIFKRPEGIETSDKFDEKKINNLIDWCTFYRRNIYYFVEHYFGIHLYFFQIIWIYLMSISDSFVAICSRADGKSWLIAVFACARAVLYPRSEITICSSTKQQAGQIISDKIIPLMNDHPNLAREISRVTTNMNKWEVDFHNGSIIKVVASKDSSRGARSVFTIYEEFPLIDKKVVDKIIRPFSYIRPVPYLMLPEYKDVAILKEEPREVFISSANHKGLWWYDETKKNLAGMIKGENSGVIFLDYSVSILHGIKSSALIKREKDRMDEISSLEEYDNIPWGENANAYFKLSMFDRVRKISKAFYPWRDEEYDPKKKNPNDITKKEKEGELRIIACDIAGRGGSANDLAITSCFRILPTRRGYIRNVVYMESFSGETSRDQALRIKQVWKDFQADFIVLDIKNIGLSVWEELGVVTNDELRGEEYPAMGIMNHPTLDEPKFKELATHTKGLNYLPNIYPIDADARLNSQIAVEMRDKLQKQMIELLVNDMDAENYLLRTNKEFANPNTDSEYKAFLQQVYLQTTLLINECINLKMSDIAMASGLVKLETSTANGRKDRYSSVSYGNYFVSLLDQDLLQEDDGGNDWDAIMGVTLFG